MNIPRDTFRNQRRGVISLLALILMAAITSIAVGASLVTITELRQSETIGQSFVAAYAAESGMENGLYEIKINRTSSTVRETITALTQNSEQPVADGTSATWHRSAVPSLKRIQVARLAPDQSAALDYYNPDDFTADLNDIGVTGTRLYVSWEDNCNGFSFLEVTATDLSSLFTGDVTQSAIAKINLPCNCVGDDCDSTDLTGHQLCSPKEISTFNFLNENGTEAPINMIDGQPMRFAFRPILPIRANDVSCTIENLTAEIHDDNWGIHDDPDDYANYYENIGWTDQDLENFHNNHTKDLPAHITLTSTGAFGRTRQALTATVPWKAPASGLLNFVLFSDLDILK